MKIVLPALMVPVLAWLIASCSSSPAVQAENGMANAPAPQEQKHPEADFSISCLECHQEVTPEVTAEWQEGQHGLVNVGCYVCHGDGEVEFYARPGSDNCMSCHSAYEVDFTEVQATNCFSCHNGHNLKFHK